MWSCIKGTTNVSTRVQLSCIKYNTDLTTSVAMYQGDNWLEHPRSHAYRDLRH